MQFDPATHRYTRREYSACPTIRHFGGWFYVAVLFSPCCGNAPRYQQVLARSRDLKTIVASPARKTRERPALASHTLQH